LTVFLEYAVLRTVVTYYVIAIVILLVASFFQSGNLYVTDVPVLLSVLLLVPLYNWLHHHGKSELAKEANAGGKGITIFWIFTLLALALSIRIPSVILFDQPYEKTPLIYLLVFTIILTEKTDLSAFGLSIRNLPRSILYGLGAFAILGGLNVAIHYGLVYEATSQMPVKSFNIQSALLTMPFMILCVATSEEGLFRGYIQTHLEKLFATKYAILGQAILFGLWHFVWNLYPYNLADMIQYVATTFFWGIIFGYFYFKTGNLVPLILAHGLWDTILPSVTENTQVMNYYSAYAPVNQIPDIILSCVVPGIVTLLFIKRFIERV
jgi:membrane protease YdiL (CAAX protease family)